MNAYLPSTAQQWLGLVLVALAAGLLGGWLL